MMTRATSRSNSLEHRQMRRLFRRLGKAVLTPLLALTVALSIPQAKSEPAPPKAEAAPHIYIIENGVAVDRTTTYSYSQSHLIWAATQEIVGETLPGEPLTLYDTTGQQVIGYLAYDACPDDTSA